jgi:hypothetical protein
MRDYFVATLGGLQKSVYYNPIQELDSELAFQRGQQLSNAQSKKNQNASNEDDAAN